MNFLVTSGPTDLLFKDPYCMGNGLDLKNVFNPEPSLGSYEFRTGKDEKGEWAQRIPAEVGLDMSLMRLGKERYDIHCAFVMVNMETVGDRLRSSV